MCICCSFWGLTIQAVGSGEQTPPPLSTKQETIRSFDYNALVMYKKILLSSVALMYMLVRILLHFFTMHQFHLHVTCLCIFTSVYCKDSEGYNPDRISHENSLFYF